MSKPHRYDNPVLRARAGLAMVAMVAVSACGGGGGGKFDDDPAVQAMRRQFDYIDKGQDGRRWDELHPAQQALIPRERFLDCNEADSVEIERVEVLEVFDEQTSIPGTDRTVASRAITVRVKASAGLLSDEFTDTFHEVEVDGAWRWVMSPDAVEECASS